MRALVALLLALGVAHYASASETFDYTMQALVVSDLRETEWIPTRWSETGHINCDITCFRVMTCGIHPLPPGHRFTTTLNPNIEVRGGETVAGLTENREYDIDLAGILTIHCPVGVYPNGGTYAISSDDHREEMPLNFPFIGFVVRQTDVTGDVLRWWVSIDAERAQKESVARTADAPDVRSGTATLDVDEILGLATHVRRVDAFTDPQGLAAEYPVCVNPSAYAPEDDPVCLAGLDPVRTDWSVTTTRPDAVVARMLNAPVLPDGSCDVASATGGGESLCASLTNVGLTLPPVTQLDLHAEGIERDSGLVVARRGEDVCFRPTVFSFDPAGPNSLQWLLGDGLTPFTPIPDGQGNYCTSGLPLGTQTVFLNAKDALGESSAARSLKNTRGPVVLVHGYGPGSPDNFDEIGPALAAKGFIEERINLQRPVNFNTIIPVPFFFNSKNLDLRDKKDAVAKLVTETRTNIEWNAMKALWDIDLPIPDRIAQIAKVLQFLKILPKDQEVSRFEIASVKALCGQGRCASVTFDAALRLHTSGDKPAFGASLFANLMFSLPAGTPLSEPLAGEIPLDWTYEGIGIAGLGVRYRIVFDKDNEGTGFFLPYIRFKAPMFGLKLANADLRGYERDLNAFVDGTLASTGYRRLSIVGYSMGGLLAHSWANNKTMTGHVEKIIAMGAPGRGSETAFLAVKAVKLLLNYLGGILGPVGQVVAHVGESMVDEITGPALRQMYPHSDYVRQANANFSTGKEFDTARSTDLVAADVQRYNYVGVDWLAGWWGPTICHVHIPFIPIADPFMNFPNTDDFIAPWLCNGDFFVTEDSATIWTHPWVQQERLEAFHVGIQDVVGADRIACDLDPSLCPGAVPVAASAPLLAAGGASGNGRLAARAASLASSGTVAVAAAAPRSPRSYQTETRDAYLAPGGALTFTVEADPSASSLIVTVGGPPLSAAVLTVEGPHGGAVQGIATPAGPAAVIDSPAAGIYTVTTALPAAAVSPEQVVVTASVATDAFLALRANGRTRTESGADRPVGEDVLLSGLFLYGNAPFVHAGVSCVIRSPDGLEHQLDLADDGDHIDGVAADGLFSATAPGDWFADAGTYVATCTALGNTQSVVVTRRSELAIRVRAVDEIGIESGSLTVGPIQQGTPAAVQFSLYNRGTRAREFVTVEVSERLDSGESRVVACRSFAPLAAGVLTPGAVIWTPAEPGCRTLQAAIVGPPGMPLDPSTTNPRAGMRRSIRVCAAALSLPMQADAGDGYSFQTGARRIVLDGTRSQNTTSRTTFNWTIRQVGGGVVIANASGPVVAVEVPRTPVAEITLSLNDPERGTAVASTQLVDRSHVSDVRSDEPFQDWQAPDAAIVGPSTARVGQPVTFTSASTDNFGQLPVQLWRLHGVNSTGWDGVGASITTTYRRLGKYTVDLLVRDAAGFSAVAQHVVTVTAPAPVVENVVMSAALESGVESTAWVALGGLGALAGEQVQVSLGYIGPSGTFVRTAGSTSPADSCGVARVPITPVGRTSGDSHVLVEVLGHQTCDPATSTCSPGVLALDPGGAPTMLDRTPPAFMILSPAGTRDLDPCAPLEVRFIVTDEGSGAVPSSARALLDGVSLPLSGDCVGEACSTTIDSLTLRPGVHTLRLEASDRAGNLAVREISLRLEASFAALLCRFEAPLCAGIAPDGIRNAVEAHLAAAQKHELSGALTTAANELAALVHFVRAQRGKGIPTPCAVAMVAEAEATIRARWGLDLAQLK